MQSADIRNILLVVLLALCGCTETGERGFKTSEPEYMEELERELTEADIPFRRGQDGFLRYDAENEEVVRNLRAQVERKLNGGIAVRYEDEGSRTFLKQLLTSQGMEFRVENRDDGEWIRWYPESDAQKTEIEMKVVERYFDTQREGGESDCKQQESPSNNSLNKDAAHTRRAC